MTQKADQVAATILEAFAAGDLPQALTPLFLDRHHDGPSTAWSWGNRLLMVRAGHRDARTFRQWQEVGRSVIKGQKAFHILAPCTYKAREADPKRGIEEGDAVVRGFRAVAVFGYSQTQGDPIPAMEEEAAFLNSLPLSEVARTWGLSLATFDAREKGSLATYRRGVGISLGIRNLRAWAHELVHAADDRRGSFSKRAGQQLDNETVADFGASILLECLGHTTESDRGGVYLYIQGYAEAAGRDVLSVCQEFLGRTCAAVELILATADEIAAHEAEDLEAPQAIAV